MGTKMKKLMTVLLLTLSIGLMGGSSAFAQSCVDFIKTMKVTAAGLEKDKARQKEVQGSISKAEGELKKFQYMECVGTARKALLAAKAK